MRGLDSYLLSRGEAHNCTDVPRKQIITGLRRALRVEVVAALERPEFGHTFGTRGTGTEICYTRSGRTGRGLGCSPPPVTTCDHRPLSGYKIPYAFSSKEFRN